MLPFISLIFSIISTSFILQSSCWFDETHKPTWLHNPGVQFSNRWLVKVAGGSRHVIEKIANEEGFKVADYQVDHWNDIFYLQHSELPEIMDYADHITQKLNSHKEIVFVTQQELNKHEISSPNFPRIIPLDGSPSPSPSRTSSFSNSPSFSFSPSRTPRMGNLVPIQISSMSDLGPQLERVMSRRPSFSGGSSGNGQSPSSGRVFVVPASSRKPPGAGDIPIMGPVSLGGSHNPERIGQLPAGSNSGPSNSRIGGLVSGLGGLLGGLIRLPSGGSDFNIPAEALSCARSGLGKGKSKYKAPVNDPKYLSEWYIQQCHDVDGKTPQYDMGVVPVWATGNHGQGIVILIVDSGVETTHDELKKNYWKKLGLDLIDNDNTPDPNYSDEDNSHGTKAAGVAVMRANNGNCGVGMAPMALLGAVRYSDSASKRIPVESTARALLFGSQYVDIVSNSWGVPDTGYSLQDLSETLLTAFKTLAYKGRKGKGAITLFAAGNGRRDKNDHCGVDVFVASIYTIAVGSAEYDGRENAYSERCASVMVTAYSGDGSSPYNVIAPDFHNKCTMQFTGTSAATPMIAGIMALTLRENKNLKFRDVQHLLAWTSQVAPLQTDGHLWKENGAKFWVSHSFGFGLADARGLTQMAKNFKSVPEMSTCAADIPTPSENSFDESKDFKLPINTDGCKGQTTEVNYLEHVQVQVYVKFPRRGAIRVKLTSPARTEAILLEPRALDGYPYGLNGWIFSSLMTWGESVNGQWLLEISVKGSGISATGTVYGISVAFNGTKDQPKHYANGPRDYNTINFGHTITVE